MEAIVNKLGISWSAVSYLIASACDEGLVHISLHASKEPRDPLSHRIENPYDVDVAVVQVSGAITEIWQLERVVGVAGGLVGDVIGDKMIVGIAQGTTASTIPERLMPKCMPGVTTVQLSGATNPMTTGLPYMGEIFGNFTWAFGTKASPFPVPAFFDYAGTRSLMWRERSIQVVKNVERNADVTVPGIGSFTSPLPSRVYAGGYLSPEEVTEPRRDRVVGDVCTVLLRTDGTYEDIEISTRTTGPTLAGPARILRGICAAAGMAKAPALAAVLRSDAVTDLVIDDECATALLEVEEGGKVESDYGAWS